MNDIDYMELLELQWMEQSPETDLFDDINIFEESEDLE